MLPIFIVLSSVVSVATLDLYPWGKYDFKEHAVDVLEGLREFEHLKVWDSTIERNLLQTKDGLTLTNTDGYTFELKVKDPNAPSKEGQRLHPARNNLEELTKALTATCAILVDGYWNYEYCHGKEVRQFHLNQKSQGVFERSPDWSLGKYKRSVAVREKGPAMAGVPALERPITKLVEYFEGGQRCEENGERRRTVVSTICCEYPKTKHKNFITADVYYGVKEAAAASNAANGLNAVKLPAFTVSTIDEPDLCTYEMTVCSPLLCERPAHTTPVLSTQATVPLKDSSVAQLAPAMKFINNTCLTKQEDWWTYELCFNSGVRQVRYDIEQSINPEGRLVQKHVLVSQYQLGMAPLELYNNESALKALVMGSNISAMSNTELAIINAAGMVTPTFRNRGTEPRYLSLEFTDGTPCDLDTVNRSTIVDIYCGPKNRFVGVWEDSTCHYHVKVELAFFCAFTEFVPHKENTTIVEFVDGLGSPESTNGPTTDAQSGHSSTSSEHRIFPEEEVGGGDEEAGTVPEVLDRRDGVHHDVRSEGHSFTQSADGERQDEPERAVLTARQPGRQASDVSRDDHAEVEVTTASDGESTRLSPEDSNSGYSHQEQRERYNIYEDLPDLRLKYPDLDMVQFARDFEAEQVEGRISWYVTLREVEAMVQESIAMLEAAEEEHRRRAAEGGTYPHEPWTDTYSGHDQHGDGFGEGEHYDEALDPEVSYEQAGPRYDIYSDLDQLQAEYPDFDLAVFARDFEEAQREGHVPWRVSQRFLRMLVEESIDMLEEDELEAWERAEDRRRQSGQSGQGGGGRLPSPRKADTE